MSRGVTGPSLQGTNGPVGSSATKTWMPRGPVAGSELANVASMKNLPPYATTSGAQNWVSAQNPGGGRKAGNGPSHIEQIVTDVAVESGGRTTPQVGIRGAEEGESSAGRFQDEGIAHPDLGQSLTHRGSCSTSIDSRPSGPVHEPSCSH